MAQKNLMGIYYQSYQPINLGDELNSNKYIVEYIQFNSSCVDGGGAEGIVLYWQV
jgi:hypothetical protein